MLAVDPNTIKDEKILARVLSEQRQASAAILGAQVRVDESRFRADSVDRVGQILEEVKAEQARMYPELAKATSYEDLL